MNNPQPPVRSGKATEEVTLSRDLNLFTITMIGVGGMIGAGIFVLTGIAAGVAGPALVLAFALNGIVTSFTALAYAELGSAFPEAGGGYLWVKEGLGGTNGFLAGWMSWFAHAVAGSLYALGFGRFASQLWIDSGVNTLGLSVEQMTLGLMTLIIIVFTYINYRGASETGSIGNIVTMTKVVILGFFVIFGVLAMLRTEAWHTRFTTGFMPNGAMGVFIAMGLTFIAFEGYEIIAQSGEEAIDPKRNIPRAIFLAIGIAVTIYIFVSITAIGATTPPAGVPAYVYLGEQKEIAIVEVAQQVFPEGLGGVLLLFSGLVSTMSALNATTYSSSRVSFAMGRDHNLPAIFAQIHQRRHTPHYAVLFSGALMLVMAWALPIEAVAAAADIMFLMLFLQVNVTVMTLRRKMPTMARGFRIPWMPAIPIIAIILNALLALNLFSFSPISWYSAIAWIVVGLLIYYSYFSKVEAMEKPKEILMEEVLVSRDYSVVVPVVTQEQARILGRIGAVIARDRGGEVLALNVVMVPPQLTLGEGRLMLKEGRPYMETVIAQAKALNVPVHTVMRLGRNVAESVRKTVDENAANLLVMGWPGYTNTAGRLFGSVIDPIVDDPPSDIAVVRYRAYRPLRSVLVPVGGGPNSRRAVSLAISMASFGDGETPARVTLLHVVPYNATASARVRAEQVISDALAGSEYGQIERQIVEGGDVAETILSYAKGPTLEEAYDLIIIGATNEPLFKNLMVGNLSERVAKEADVTVIVVKRRSSPLHSFLRQTVLEPSTNGTIESKEIQE
jgi:amino acid transporter/nucleotide-binding universal stress UspA family protein